MIKANILIILTIIFIASGFWIKSASKGNDFCSKDVYENYKKNFMSQDGRIIDTQRNNITTSEGQSYIMLRSVLSDDKSTFDLTYNWAKNNLQRPDFLFAWHWGKSNNGEYKILDENSASDADIDIAFALILAYEKWGEKKYLEAARPIINSIFENETKQIGDYLVLMPGILQVSSQKTEINPSYFATYPFKVFQKYDEKHDWNKLVDSSYHFLKLSIKTTKTGLPPDWCLIENDKILLEMDKSDFSYDAIRIFPRLFLDYKMTGEKRALPILSKVYFFIERWTFSGKSPRPNSWDNTKTFYVNYKANGQLKNNDEPVGSIAVLLPIINFYKPKTATEIYKKKILPTLEDEAYWTNNQGYYSKNLLWFGCYLYEDFKGTK